MESLGIVADELQELLRPDGSDVQQVAAGKRRILLLGRNQRSKLAAQLRAQFNRKGIEVFSLAESPSAGTSVIEKTTQLLQSADYAILVTELPDEQNSSDRTRQNMMFELGLAVATLGRDRVILVAGRGFEAPTDLLGLKYLLVERGDPATIVPAVDAMITALAD
jgi:predicted nucleotide-binding protein